MDLSRDVRITLLAFAVMCLAAAGNLFFFQGRPGLRNASIAPVAHVSPLRGTEAAAPRSAATLQATETQTRIGAVAAAAPVATASVPDSTGAVQPATDSAEVIRAIQKSLTARGYEPGQADGVPGLITRAAIMAYEYDSGLVMTATPSREVMQHLLVGASGEPGKRQGAPEIRGTEAIAIAKWVARQLQGAGYAAGSGDGSMGPEFVKAIRDYEAAQKIPVTGRISAPLVARLAKPPAAKVSAR